MFVRDGRFSIGRRKTNDFTATQMSSERFARIKLFRCELCPIPKKEKEGDDFNEKESEHLNVRHSSLSNGIRLVLLLLGCFLGGDSIVGSVGTVVVLSRSCRFFLGTSIKKRRQLLFAELQYLLSPTTTMALVLTYLRAILPARQVRSSAEELSRTKGTNSYVNCSRSRFFSC